MKSYIQFGIDQGVISLHEDRSRITNAYQKEEHNKVLHMKCAREAAVLYFGGSADQQRAPSIILYIEYFDLPPATPTKATRDSVSHPPITSESKGSTGRRRAHLKEDK